MRMRSNFSTRGKQSIAPIADSSTAKEERSMRNSFNIVKRCVVAAFVVAVGAPTLALAVTINIDDLTEGVPVVTADTPLTFVTQIPEFVEFTFHSGFLFNFPGYAAGYNILEVDNTLSDRLNATLVNPASDV